MPSPAGRYGGISWFRTSRHAKPRRLMNGHLAHAEDACLKIIRLYCDGRRKDSSRTVARRPLGCMLLDSRYGPGKKPAKHKGPCSKTPSLGGDNANITPSAQHLRKP